MVEEGRLRLRKGALAFLDECLLEPNAHVVIIGATASAPEENVLGAVLRAMGPLRAAAVSGSDANEIVDGAALAATAAEEASKREATGKRPWTTMRWMRSGTTRLCTTRRGRRRGVRCR